MAVSGAVLDNSSFKHFSDELTFSRSKFLILLGCNPWYSTHVIYNYHPNAYSQSMTRVH